MFDYLVNGVMMPVLVKFHDISGSYGFAIIMLTVLVRLLIFPLSAKQYRSMKEMQELQPMLKQIQAKYKDNPQELNQAMMAFYQEHKVNPFGGCLPLLIQMPFLIALYSVLISESFAQRVGHQGWLFIHDLTRVGFYPLWHPPLDPYVGFFHYLTEGALYWDNVGMIALFGITTYVTQLMMMTDPNDPMQRQMLNTMPLVITVMFLLIPLPAGVLLYTVFSNFFTMGQYLVLKNRYGVAKPAGAVASAATIDIPATPVKARDSHAVSKNKERKNGIH
ncbi:MAG: membrane protein insertase YidC [Candidatus Sericytochromatia bacterium]|nr:membrane protein insertase YidC [Candidatus Sericytochromatia bacterium]